MWCQKIRQTKKPGLGVRDKSELRRIRQTYLIFSCLAYSVSISQTGISQTCHFHVSDLFHGPSLSGLFHTQLRKEVSGLFQGQMSGLFQGPVCLSHVSPKFRCHEISSPFRRHFVKNHFRRHFVVADEEALSSCEKYFLVKFFMEKNIFGNKNDLFTPYPF